MRVKIVVSRSVSRDTTPCQLLLGQIAEMRRRPEDLGSGPRSRDRRRDGRARLPGVGYAASACAHSFGGAEPLRRPGYLLRSHVVLGDVRHSLPPRLTAPNSTPADPVPTGDPIGTAAKESHENHCHQRPGQRPGKGAALLHRRARLLAEVRCPGGSASMADGRIPRRPRRGPELLLEPDAHPAARPFKEALVGDGIPYTSFAVEASKTSSSASAHSACDSPNPRHRWVP